MTHVAGSLGGGALHKLNAAGIRAFQTQGGSIFENIALLNAGTLPEYLPGHTCGGHGHSHGCSHQACHCPANCHAANGVLYFKELGYSSGEMEKLTSPELLLLKTFGYRNIVLLAGQMAGWRNAGLPQDT